MANLFEGLALDRAAERRDDAAWLQSAWPEARVLSVDFEGRAPLDPSGAGLAYARGAAIATQPEADSCFLGIDESGVVWFARPAAGSHPASDWIGLREAAARLSAFDSGLFAYAKALLLWHTRARYCGACAAATEPTRAGHCRRCSNADCRLEQFPRTDAAIIVLVTDGPRALIGRQAGWPPRRYSTLAGFVEPGESLEDAVRREVREEAGVRVGACRYHSSQPWPFPASLMLGFRAEASDPGLQLGDELEDARWLDAPTMLAELESGALLLSPPISVSFRLLADWLLESADPARVRALLPDA